jgi:glucosamine 6-phosphate synthetase-like amidotransferase/phosphosugar isomerase protein
MCGIGGLFVKDMALGSKVDTILDTLLKSLDHRGGDACGFVAVTDDGIAEWQKAAVDADKFNKYRREAPATTRVLLAHTRWATQGHEGFMENNHPIRRGPFLIIHNGHISNDREVFKLANRQRYGQVDSECIAAHLAHVGSLELLPETMEALYGAAAVAAIDDREPGKLALARGYGSPLWVLETRRILIFGSTQNSVLDAHHYGIGRIKTSQARELDEGEMLLINNGNVTSHSFKPQEFRWTYTSKTPISAGLSSTSTACKVDRDDGVISWCRCDICDEDTLDVMHKVPDVDGLDWLVCENCYYELAGDDAFDFEDPTDPTNEEINEYVDRGNGRISRAWDWEDDVHDNLINPAGDRFIGL